MINLSYVALRDHGFAPGEVSPEDTGRYAQGHWGVEKEIHCVRYVTFG